MRQMTATLIAVAVAGLALTGGAASAGGGCHLSGPDDRFTDSAGTTVKLGACRFTPTVVRIETGDKITWLNSSREPHTVSGAAASWGTENELFSGDSVTYSFDQKGVFPYFCAFHPSMVGAVVVGDGSAASNGTAAGDGVKAVSLQAPGGAQGADANPEVIEEDSGSDNTVPLIIGVGVLAAIAGFAAAFVTRRRAEPKA